jgi:hypothetical protein
MAQHANEPMPRVSLLLTQRCAHIAQHDQAMRQASLAKRSPAHFPLTGAARKRDVEHLRRRPFKTCGEAKIVRIFAHQLRRRTAQQTLARAIHEPQTPRIVERKHRNVDLCHDGAEQGRGFQRSQPLIAQRVSEGIDLEQGLAERVVALGASRAKREIAFPQGFEQIRHRLERKNYTMTKG